MLSMTGVAYIAATQVPRMPSPFSTMPHSRLVWLILPLVLASCQPNAVPARPNILWISTEDMSPALGSYGDAYAVTPHLDQLAARGVRYMHAFASAPICAPARSTLITGVHATSLGTQHLRSVVDLPDGIRTLPEYLREAGYYTTNNVKTDYNFSAEGRWDANSSDAHWRNRPDGAPFFSVFNFMTTHEGPINNADEALLAGLEERHDPAEAVLPPYFPDTPEMRRIWARMYDLITVMDAQAGAVLEQLEADGLADETIVIFFSDHGHGLPRYKRWAHRTGHHIPLIVYAPPRYRHLLQATPGEAADEIVSFVDFAPTMLSLAGIAPPEHMQGQVFLGPERDAPRTHFVGARSRADDVYDVARTVIDDRYVYIRNFTPHKPYIQEALIFGDQKASYRELHRARAAGLLPDAGEAMYLPKPREELYDLQADPHELDNLALSPNHTTVLNGMRARLNAWVMETRDVGFLNEGEVMLRSAGSTPYEMAHDAAQYDLDRIREAAGRVGDAALLGEAINAGLNDADSGVRYWSAVAAQASNEPLSGAALTALARGLGDASPAVAIASAEALCTKGGDCGAARTVILDYIQDERPWLALQAAIALRRLGPAACAVSDEVEAIFPQYRGDAMGRYSSWMYPMFVGFALDQVRLTCGTIDRNPLTN